MSDISLTASMRSNLLSLQNTANLMDKTQERLSTGQKVNSALDNPSSYYTARSLDNRAGDLNTLLDSMGQGISTVKAANEGIESITSFVEQAKAVANSARDQSSRQVAAKGEFSTTPAKVKYTFSLDSKDYTIESDKTGAKLATEIADYLKNTADPKVMAAEAEYDETTGKITIKDDNAGTHTTSIDGYSFKISVNGKKDPVYVDSSSATSLTDVVNTINTALTGLTDDAGNAIEGLKAVASDDGKSLTIESDNGVEAKVSGSANGLTLDGTTGSSSRVNYMQQFNDLLEQITDLAKDSGYKGVNLLQKDSLTVVFNEDRSSNLVIEGDDASAEGLGLVKATDWGTNEGIDASLEKVDAAISSLRNMSSKFGNNYSILQTREEFTENLVNVLEEGADKLTLADMNEESANMLALQTRQQLAVNSLSLASQASQSVLQLFQ